MAGERLGRRLAHIAYAEGEEDAFEGDLLRRLQAVEEALCGPLLPAFEADELEFADVVQVGRRAGQAAVVELLHGGLAGQDVHRLAADEVHQAPLDLHRAAVLVGAEPFRFVLRPYQRRAAVGADARENGRLCILDAMGRIHAGNLRDDLSALLDEDPVAHADVQQGHLVGIVERRALDERAAELDRGKVRHGRDRAGASHLVVDAEQLGAGLLRLEFIGDGPAGRLGRVAQRPLAGELVDLDHDAVGGVGEELALLVPVVDVVLDLADAPAEAAFVGDGQTPAGGCVERFAVGVEGHRFGGNVVEGADEAAVCDFLGIDELEGSGGGVARVREGGLFLGFALAVEGVEGLVGHQDLAADFEFFGIIPVQLLRDARNAADVVRHVVALDAVAAGQGLDQPAVPVGQADGRAVELEFAAVAERDAVQDLVGPGGEFFDFFDGVGVAQRQHGVAVRALDEALAGLRFGVGAHGGVQVGADAVGGGVGVVELRECRLERLQLMHQLVELVVGDRRRIIHIIAPAVLPEGLPEFVYPYFCVLFLHGLARVYTHNSQKYVFPPGKAKSGCRAQNGDPACPAAAGRPAARRCAAQFLSQHPLR